MAFEELKKIEDVVLAFPGVEVDRVHGIAVYQGTVFSIRTQRQIDWEQDLFSPKGLGFIFRGLSNSEKT
jgi:hypothetical protein